MRESVEAQTLLYAVQRAMLCQECDRVLHVRKSVLALETGQRWRIYCSRCWDRVEGEVDVEELTDGRAFEW